MSLFRLEQTTFRVLREVTLELPWGASCVWGPSGAGKSTLLRLCNRLAEPEAGRVLFDGRDVRTLDPLQLRRRVALVQQLPVPFAGTVAENIGYGAGLVGRRVDAAALLEHVSLPARYAENDTRTLSVGELQRVMLARALALEPAVLLLDEPTSALDEASRARVEESLLHLRDELGVAYVVVTHDRAQATRLADWFVEIEDGRVRAAGPALAE